MASGLTSKTATFTCDDDLHEFVENGTTDVYLSQYECLFECPSIDTDFPLIDGIWTGPSVAYSGEVLQYTATCAYDGFHVYKNDVDLDRKSTRLNSSH